MALFTSYAPPGVYTNVIIQSNAAPALGTARIPVIIGEGTEFFTENNVELFRGSSAIQDDQSVNENISDQVTGLTRNFQTTFFPVVDGSGKGVVTNDPSKIKVQAIDADGNATIVTVITLNGATGAFVTQDIVPAGSTLTITYFFKRGDTLVQSESLLAQVPTAAALYINSSGALSQSASGALLTLGTTVPGALGNEVSVQFVVSNVGALDAQAVSGAGTDDITITTTKSTGTATITNIVIASNVVTITANNSYTVGQTVYLTGLTTVPALNGQAVVLTAVSSTTFTFAFTNANVSSTAETGKSLIVRTVSDLATLITAGIPTLSAGYLTTTATSSTKALAAGAAVQFSGGVGPSSNTIFKVKNTPIVDGTNGGVVTTDVTKVTVQVNGSTVSVAALDGLHGLVTLTNAVPSTASSLTITYYFNTWMNTYDLLPSANVGDIIQVGLGPDRSDFTEGTDYALGTALDNQGNVIANTVNWGASVTEAIGVSAAGESANFTPAEVLETLVDELVYLRPLTGAVDGKNVVFTLAEAPTDGSGVGKITDDPSLVKVYVGSDALEAFINGPLTGGTAGVASLNGKAQQVTLFNPPQAGQKVFATYWRNTLNNHQYTVKVVNPGFAGLGTYNIADELGNVLPVVTQGTNTVADAGFATSGIVFPFGFSDAQAPAGAIDETITLTFRNDGAGSTTPAVQATVAITVNSAILTFTASIGGAIGNNVKVAINATDTNAIPVVVNGDLVTIYSNWDGTVHTGAQVASYFPSAPTKSGGKITCIASGTTTNQINASVAATSLASGADAITTPVTHSYTVSSNQANGSSGIGYLDQTYIDAKTGFRVTIVNPSDHASYGVPILSPSYAYAVGDTLQFVVSKSAVRHTGNPGVSPCEANNQVAIPGLKSKVVSNFGSTTGDTVIVSTEKYSGNNPNIGEFYYVTFTVDKTAADYAIKLYTRPTDAYAAYGQPSTVNRLSLGIQLMSQNGVQTFGAIQVKKQAGQNIASDNDYIAAIQSLAVQLPGFTRKADVIVPLSTSPTVHQFLSRQLTTQAGIRQKGEAIGFVGYNQFATPAQMRANARALANKRVIAIGSPAAGILITDTQTGVSVEYAVSGEFMAAAMAGLNCNPANDVATSLTNQNLVGFSRLLVKFDDPTMDFMASDGLTLLLDNNGALQIRHYKTTDPSNPLTSEPTSVTIADYVAQQFRGDLKQFIGRKLISSLVTDITTVCNARLKSLVDQQIISGYQNLSVVPDPTDPTQVDVTVTFKPIFSLLYVSVTFTVQTTL